METTENTSAKAEQEQTTDEEQGQPEAGSDNVENLNAEANDSSEQKKSIIISLLKCKICKKDLIKIVRTF